VLHIKPVQEERQLIKRNWKKIIAIMIIITISMSLGVYAAFLLDSSEVTYNKNGTTITVKQALDELETKTIRPKIGDVVNYNANSNGTYTYTTNTTDTTANDYTGGTTYSTFRSDNSMVWKIMDINNETGAIKLMSADGTPSSLQLKGRAGYAYCENILNNISKVYGHGIGATRARSVTVEDINYITGYNLLGNSCGMHTQSYTSNSYWLDLTYENGKVKTFETKTASSSSPYIQTGDKCYDYTGTDYLANTTNTYKMIFQNTSGSDRKYWLASRCVFFASSTCSFYVRRVQNGFMNYNSLCYSRSSSEGYYSMSICPVVSLNSTVQLTWDSTNNRWNIS
jgi:hypothetical protein